MKPCSKCGQTKSAEHFYKLKTGKLSSWCRECNRAVTARWKETSDGKASAKRYWRSEKGRAHVLRFQKTEKGREAKSRYGKSEKGKATARRSYLKLIRTEEGRHRVNEFSKRSYRNNLERIKKYRRSPRVREMLKKAGEKYNRTNKGRETNRRSTANRRATLMERRSTLTREDWEAIKRSQAQRCAYCKKKRPLTIDHVIPLSKGGHHEATNVVAACKPCNSRKGDRILTLF